MTPTLLLLFSLLSPAALEESTDFQAGVAFYQELELEQALLKFKLASVAHDLSTEDQAVVVLWIGMTYGGMGDDAAARQSFRDAFALDANAPLPAIMPPTLKAIADEERASRPAEAPVPEPSPEEAGAPDEMAAATEGAVVEGSSSEPEAPRSGEPSPGGMPWLLLAGGGTAAVAAVAGVGSGALGVMAVMGYLFATNPGNFQSEADMAVLFMNLEIAAAGMLGVAALGLLGGGAALAATELVLE